MIPPKAYEPTAGPRSRRSTRYAKLFDLGAVGDEARLPDVHEAVRRRRLARASRRIDDEAALRKALRGERQAGHAPAAGGARRSTASCAASASARRRTCVLLRPRRAAARPLHDGRRTSSRAEEAQHLRDMTLTINAFFGWDFNSCEALRKDGVWHPIDFANPCPDSQVTSLHYHFPWLVKANLRWSIFCAATKRPMRKNLDWEPFYAIARARTCRTREKLRAYAAIADERFETDALRGVLRQAPGAPRRGRVGVLRHAGRAKDAVRQKVAALFPAHEVEQFTELFWQRIQAWRADEPARPERRRRRRSARWHSRAPRSARSRSCAGARSASRCCCSRPPAATPRRSSAST